MSCSVLPGCSKGEDLLLRFQAFFSSSDRKPVRRYGELLTNCKAIVWWLSKVLSHRGLMVLGSWISLTEAKWAACTPLQDLHFCLMQSHCDAICSYCSPLKWICLPFSASKYHSKTSSDLLGHVIKKSYVSSVNCCKFYWNVRVNSYKTVFAITVPQPKLDHKLKTRAHQWTA